MASPAQPSAELDDSQTPPILRLPEDLLGIIFLLLPALADVGRAATACPAFRRVVADRSFLHRLHRARPAPFIGFFFCRFHPVEAPHPSAPIARTLTRAADLCFSFVHTPHPFSRWYPADACDGRVLLRHTSCSNFVVCDPLYRRSVLLPRIPGQAATAPQCPFLVPTKNGEAETSFEVGCMVESEEPGRVSDVPRSFDAFIFSSATGQWSDLVRGAKVDEPKPYYACGCFYWKMSSSTLLELDTSNIEFQLVQVPFRYRDRDFVIAEAGKGKKGIFSLRHNNCRAASSLICAVHEEGRGWQFKKRVGLPSRCRYSFVAARERCLLLHGTPWNKQDDAGPSNENSDSGIGYFSVESDTMKIEKVCGLKAFLDAMPYTRFPPSLCLPSV